MKLNFNVVLKNLVGETVKENLGEILAHQLAVAVTKTDEYVVKYMQWAFKLQEQQELEIEKKDSDHLKKFIVENSNITNLAKAPMLELFAPKLATTDGAVTAAVKLNFNVALKSLNGEEVKENLGEILAHQLAIAVTKTEEYIGKYMEWAVKLQKGEELGIDKQDAANLKKFISANENITNLAKAPMLETFSPKPATTAEETPVAPTTQPSSEN